MPTISSELEPGNLLVGLFWVVLPKMDARNPH
jgi:hypothetical protein